ncbi:spore coat protein CotF [Peribacillus huizhouensis]|uniref:Spore coat protein CotF n=2 Tax=Peribacillus huizhouensis TaxID=1501239 RepID=A0ABR6CPK9_9BACI|nr:spore coat protein CotF [Peribacillus huizhouensis]
MPNQSKVQNPESPIPKTPQMNERDFVNDMLSTEKYLKSSYGVALNELSNQTMYQDIQSIYTEVETAQRELYYLMFEKGWYALEQEDTQKIGQAYQQFSGYKTQFPYGPGIQ